MVDAARVIKRMRPAPQGRGYRVRKRSNHVTVVVDIPGVDTKKSKLVKVTPNETVNVQEPLAAAKKTRTKKESGTK